MMIKAVIFDCFGVLVTDSWLPFKHQHFGDNVELWAKATAVNVQLDTGKISFEEFVDAVATLAGVDSNATRTQLEYNPQNHELFTYIEQQLAGNYAIGLLSNAGDNWLDELFTPEQNKLFSAAVLSCEIGYAKPNPQAYRAIIEKLNIKPHEAIFVDDQQRYIIGAQEFGLHTIHYTSNQHTFTELKKITSDNK